MLGGVAGVGVAVGPILGGYFTTNLTWRWIFVAEAAIVVVLLALSTWLDETEAARRPSIDPLSTALSSLGLGLAVLAVLQSSSWGWLEPRNSPVEPFGFALTPFLLALGGVLVWAFTVRQRYLEGRGDDPLVRLGLFSILQLRAGLVVFTVQNFTLLGLFFTIPLYLQLTQGLDAFETGVRLLPVSVTMFIFALSGPLLSRVASPRSVIRVGLLVIVGSGALLVGTIGPELDGSSFALAAAVLGTGMGLLASQLGNVVQSAASDEDRSEVGGLQYTAQNLGSALGTAFVGAVLIGAMTSAFGENVADDPALAPLLEDEAVTTQLRAGLPFVDSEDLAFYLQERTELTQPERRSVVEAYEEAQLRGLKVAILAVSVLALGGLAFTRHLPSTRRTDESPSVQAPRPRTTGVK